MWESRARRVSFLMERCGMDAARLAKAMQRSCSYAVTESDVTEALAGRGRTPRAMRVLADAERLLLAAESGCSRPCPGLRDAGSRPGSTR